MTLGHSSEDLLLGLRHVGASHINRPGTQVLGDEHSCSDLRFNFSGHVGNDVLPILSSSATGIKDVEQPLRLSSRSIQLRFLDTAR